MNVVVVILRCVLLETGDDKQCIAGVASSPDLFPAFQCCTLKSVERLGMGLGTRLYLEVEHPQVYEVSDIY